MRCCSMFLRWLVPGTWSIAASDLFVAYAVLLGIPASLDTVETLWRQDYRVLSIGVSA